MSIKKSKSWKNAFAKKIITNREFTKEIFLHDLDLITSNISVYKKNIKNLVRQRNSTFDKHYLQGRNEKETKFRE